MIGNENTALREAENENKLLKMNLESTRQQLEEMHLPVSVRKARARSLNRLSVELIKKLCSFLDDECLFRCRILCRGFHAGYLNQEITTAVRAERTNMKRLVRLAKLGRTFPNVSIVLVNWTVANRCLLSGVDVHQFPSMSDLVVESIGSFYWRRLPKNPKIKSLTVLHAKLDLRTITKKRYPNLEYLAFKLFGPTGRYWKLSDLPKHSRITRIDLVNMEPGNELTVDMIKPLSKTRFPNLKMVGVFNEWSMSIQGIQDLWLFLQKKKLNFRYTCGNYDFSNGDVRGFLDRKTELDV